MKKIAFVLVLLATTPAAAQNFRFTGQNGNQVWGRSNAYGGVIYDGYGNTGYWQSSNRSYGYGGGYGGYVPQQYYPMSWGAIPGYQTNGYFVPGWYGW